MRTADGGSPPPRHRLDVTVLNWHHGNAHRLCASVEIFKETQERTSKGLFEERVEVRIPAVAKTQLDTRADKANTKLRVSYIDSSAPAAYSSSQYIQQPAKQT